ncbi:MAG: 16S rRNA (cytosine(1402)-N(4))-methyltransferase RsmH [Bacteroidetes bacterium]|nr:16S rRNA (cytosine(1402)-N(4))-methyltransferase RsmH [Bacteroidota bacterium]
MANEEKHAKPINQSTNQPVNYHVPVLLRETIEGLRILPGGIYVDCTFGGGGHSRAILQQLNASGKLFVFDQDADAAANLPGDERVVFIPQNFRHLQRFLRLHKITQVDGILADLGVSSHQFDEAERGFSTRFDAALDMRMDQREALTAAQVLQTATEQELHKMFEQYGEVTNSKTLAKMIVQQRQVVPMRTINEFKLALKTVVKGNPQKYFAQVFQALRIRVNDELEALKELLQQSAALLKPQGRIAIITFHSLEDRMVKNFFRNGSFSEPEADEVYGTRPGKPLLVITKKPIVPGTTELQQNPRSRSAKLRVAEKKETNQ